MKHNKEQKADSGSVSKGIAKPLVMRRFIIAVDSVGVHFRKTLCTTHHGETGEVSYDAEPIFSTHDKGFKKKLIALVKSVNGA